jgi:methanogenic corrinoid protein MtbC1
LGQRNAAINIAVEALSNGASSFDVYVELCSKTLWEIGEMWERNQISVADEHRATAIVQYVVAQIYSRIPLHPRHRGNVIVTGVEGEMHQLGGNIVADLLEADGWDVCFLGTNLPHHTILEKIGEHQAFAVFISVTVPFNLLRARRLVADIRARFGSKILIILGGQAFVTAAGFFKDAGADAFAPTAHAGAAIIAERAAFSRTALEPGSQE